MKFKMEFVSNRFTEMTISPFFHAKRVIKGDITCFFVEPDQPFSFQLCSSSKIERRQQPQTLEIPTFLTVSPFFSETKLD